MFTHTKKWEIGLHNDTKPLVRGDGTYALQCPSQVDSLPTILTLEAFKHLVCHHYTQHRDVIAVFWMRERYLACVGSMEYMF
jgi:hypothetical protein